jgi:hypothetical protein
MLTDWAPIGNLVVWDDHNELPKAGMFITS